MERKEKYELYKELIDEQIENAEMLADEISAFALTDPEEVTKDLLLNALAYSGLQLVKCGEMYNQDYLGQDSIPDLAYYRRLGELRKELGIV